MRPLHIRRLERHELDAAVPLLAAEGWAFEPPEVARLAALGGAMGALQGGELVGALTFIDLTPVRWIGNVVVAPHARGHGVAGRLVEETLVAAGPRATPPSAGLYSVEKAVGLYERAGFEAKGQAFVMHATSPLLSRDTDGAQRLEKRDLAEVGELDQKHTGMDRSWLLAAIHDAFPNDGVVLRRGGRIEAFGMLKPWKGLTELGPVVAPHAEDAGRVLDALLARAHGPVEAAVLDGGPVNLLKGRGFERAARIVPMFRGAPPAWDAHALVAAAGLEKS